MQIKLLLCVRVCAVCAVLCCVDVRTVDAHLNWGAVIHVHACGMHVCAVCMRLSVARRIACADSVRCDAHACILNHIPVVHTPCHVPLHNSPRMRPHCYKRISNSGSTRMWVGKHAQDMHAYMHTCITCMHAHAPVISCMHVMSPVVMSPHSPPSPVHNNVTLDFSPNRMDVSRD